MSLNLGNLEQELNKLQRNIRVHIGSLGHPLKEALIAQIQDPQLWLNKFSQDISTFLGFMEPLNEFERVSYTLLIDPRCVALPDEMRDIRYPNQLV